jgi:hypothetical protein
MMCENKTGKVKIKRGTVRKDGKIFWCYKIKNGTRFPCWLTPEQFKNWDAKRKEYSLKKRAEYKAQQAALPPEERNYTGKQDPVTGLYFLQVLNNGKPQFGNLEQLKEFQLKVRLRSKKYHTKCRQQNPPPSVCIGDKHPTDANLCVIKIWGNKVYYGTWEKLQKRRESHRRKDQNYRDMNRERLNQHRSAIKKKVMEVFKTNPELKMKRGYINPITKEIFWVYDAYGREVWLHIDEFNRRRNNACQKRKIARNNDTQN